MTEKEIFNLSMNANKKAEHQKIQLAVEKRHELLIRNAH